MTHALTLVGRSSSHYTRVVRIVASELGIVLPLEPVFDMTRTDAEAYAGNPARKLPTLRTPAGLVFGTEHICRTLAESVHAEARILWPWQLEGSVARNAQELVSHGMQAQVQLVLGTGGFGRVSADNPYFAKVRAGFEGALTWLDERLDEVRHALVKAELSLLEVMLFCLVEHLAFRATLPLEPYATLRSFAADFGMRASARDTPYRVDA